MATVEIRQLGVKDARDYRAIRLAALRESPEAFGSVYEVEAAAPAERHLARLRGSVVFGAYVDGEIVGLVGLRREEGFAISTRVLCGGFMWRRPRGGKALAGR